MDNDEKTGKGSFTGPSLGYTDVFSKRDMWKEIADTLYGEFKITLSPGNEIESHHISIPYKAWKIEISVCDSRPLKYQIAFPTCQNFELTISWEDFLDRIRKKLGKPEIEFGWEDFDKHYLVESKTPDLVKQILTTEIQRKLLKYNVYSLTFHPDTHNNSAELMSTIQKTACDKEMAFDLIEMFKLMIDNLIKSGILHSRG